MPAVTLVDTGSSISLLSGPFYRRVLQNGRKLSKPTSETRVKKKLRCANDLPMKIIAEVATTIKLGGVEWPATFVVVGSSGEIGA